MRIQQVDSILKESHLARKANEHQNHDRGGVADRIAAAVKSRNGKRAAGAIAGLAVATAGAIYYHQSRRLRKFWEL